MLRAGVVGLGQIGGGVAISLARSGLLSAVYDIRPDVAANLDGVPANASTLADVARNCDVVIIAVYDAAQARTVLQGPEGLLAAARPDLKLVLLSTIEHDKFLDLRALTLEHGVELLDCGVTGGNLAAVNGLVALIGGTDEAVAAVRPVVEGFAKKMYHMGPPGAGLAAKIARNIVVYVTWLAEHEAMAVAKRAGVDVMKLADAIDASADGVGPSCRWVRRDPKYASEPYPEGGRHYLASVLEKDLKAATELGAGSGLLLPGVALTRVMGREIVGLGNNIPDRGASVPSADQRGGSVSQNADGSLRKNLRSMS
ncbi:NAD(P)-dependent oxidoreductase [Sphingomonas sp. SRS2]|uniref:NAD(P)-dependent oxidoreductase n=1 Tax=Sphingomonas sp. SRS2 TaxID=133190 RepID=UPI000A01B08B|nr:NAD(P)-dependent oxidoreductase [Sphingomonas sp. SRS2]